MAWTDNSFYEYKTIHCTIEDLQYCLFPQNKMQIKCITWVMNAAPFEKEGEQIMSYYE